jgi:FKBP-type peptidyl-prolyl cis-trans isomerase FklB
MKNTFIAALTLIAAGAVTTGVASAQAPAANAPATGSQQAPAANTQQTPAAKPTPAKPTAKPGAATAAKKPAPLELKTDKDKASYAIGMNIGQNLRKQPDEIDPAIVQRGIKDTLDGGTMLMTEEQAKAALASLQGAMRAKQEQQRKIQEEQMQQAGEANKKEGEAFLAANKTKDGVVTLPSGLQYKILTEGTGPKPTAADTVVCNYKGTLLNGTEFDNSAKHGGPATFPLNGVIKGWTEALQLMPVGSKWQLFIPSDLAYGQRGPGGGIGPNSTLVFEVELISIKPKEPAKDAGQDTGKAPANGVSVIAPPKPQKN